MNGNKPKKKNRNQINSFEIQNLDTELVDRELNLDDAHEVEDISLENVNSNAPISSILSQMVIKWNEMANLDSKMPRRIFYKCFDTLKSHLQQVVKLKNAMKTRA